jgi:hypothetical protein
MTEDTSVKIFSSSEAQLPSNISESAGSLISVLDAVLVNGYGEVSVSSITVLSGVATVVTSTDHNFTQPFLIPTKKVILISGATPSELNGEKRITVVDATTFTYETTSPDGSATGTITAKVAGAGWTIEATGTNLKAYSNSAADNPAILRISDGVSFARVNGFSVLDDLTLGLGKQKFPNESQIVGGLSWNKYSSGPGTWFIVADHKVFYVFTSYSTYVGFPCGAFGQYKSPDPLFNGNNFIMGRSTTSTTATQNLWAYNSPGFTFAQKSPNDLSISINLISAGGLGMFNSYSGVGNISYPNFDGSLLIEDVVSIFSSVNPIYYYGKLYGLLNLPQNLITSSFLYSNLWEGFPIQNLTIPGKSTPRDVLIIPFQAASTTILGNAGAIDLTGPWE